MKIAFDATVVHGRKSGVGYYCQELLRELVRLERTDEYFIFSHRPLTDEVVTPGPDVRFSGGRFCPVRAFYLHALLPGILASEQPDLVHYTNFLSPLSGSPPYVLTVHDMSLERLGHSHPVAKRLYTKRLIPGAVRRAKLILTNSEFSKWDTVRYLGVPEERIRVTPLAASSIFRPVSLADRRETLDRFALDEPYFLYVGNIEPRKNLDRLLEAFSASPLRNHLLVIAGNRWFRGHDLSKKVVELGLEQRVRLLGYVSRSELPALMSGARAFVYPSLLEGFGLPVLEAMSCGAPVVTSSTSALGEVAGDAALKVEPTNVGQLREAMIAVAQDPALRKDLSAKALHRASEFSWTATAEATRNAYSEAFERNRGAEVSFPVNRADPSAGQLHHAVRSTLEYAARFNYPLTVPELRDRLFRVEASVDEVAAAVEEIGIPEKDGYLSIRSGHGMGRIEREQWTGQVLDEFRRELGFLVSVPFVRMLAFSGATAHRNMTDRDVDLFAVVEDGKLWATLLMVTLWAKSRGLRRNICLNYIVSDQALPLFETDLFTAQQAASLKPFFGRHVYDRFISLNPFIRRCFPNFDPAIHRNHYREMSPSPLKKFLELLLRLGPVQIVEWTSRIVWGGHLRRKQQSIQDIGATDVLLEKRRIKLHLRSHKQELLAQIRMPANDVSVRDSVPGTFTPPVPESRQENAKVHGQ